MSGQWEVVINKKNVQKEKRKLSKAEKKRFAENAPKIEDIVPIAQMKTLYDNLDDTKPEISGEQSVPNHAGEPKKVKKKEPKKKAESSDKAHSKPQPKRELSLSKITVKDVMNLIEVNETKFNGVPSIFLKDLASLMNVRTDSKNQKNEFTARSFEHPLCLLPVDVQKVIKTHLKKMKTPTFVVVFTECLEALAKDMVKDNYVIGYKIVLQLIAIHYPQVIISSMHNFTNLCLSYQNRPAICTTLLWALCQAGFKDISVGLTVWSKVMLPLCQQKKYTSFVIDYLKQLVGRHSTSKGLSTDQYFSLLDDLLKIWPKLETNKAQELLTQFSRLKLVLCNVLPKERLHTLFEPLMDRVTVTDGLTLQREPLLFIAQCLREDKQSYSVWTGHYTNKVMESIRILQFIDSNWELLDLSSNYRDLWEILCTFKLTNEKLDVTSRNKANKYNECNALCNQILLRIPKRRNLIWKFLACFLVVVAAVLVGTSNELFDATLLKKYLTDPKSPGAQSLNFVWQESKQLVQRVYGWLVLNIGSDGQRFLNYTENYVSTFSAYFHGQIQMMLQKVDMESVESSWKLCKEYLSNLTRAGLSTEGS